ncbi:MAG TPA: winged helix-turn-helix domain-containing protein, partial [Anaerolineae bacterium]|nr:winged helix-turn-helix domain-containing protein [Anaerolineae bacterium]
GPEYRDEREYLRVYVRYLRQKLEADPANPRLILTQQGAGYRLAALPPE